MDAQLVTVFCRPWESLVTLPVLLRRACGAGTCTFPININVYTAHAAAAGVLLIRGTLQGLLFLSRTDVFSLSVWGNFSVVLFCPHTRGARRIF